MISDVIASRPEGGEAISKYHKKIKIKVLIKRLLRPVESGTRNDG
jgi:hypothetical protein